MTVCNIHTVINFTCYCTNIQFLVQHPIEDHMLHLVTSSSFSLSGCSLVRSFKVLITLKISIQLLYRLSLNLGLSDAFSCHQGWYNNGNSVLFKCMDSSQNIWVQSLTLPNCVTLVCDSSSLSVKLRNVHRVVGIIKWVNIWKVITVPDT